MTEIVNTSVNAAYDTHQYNFGHQEVRDLAWCCLSQPLLAGLPGSDAQIWRNSDPERDLAWLKQLDQNPQPLIEHLAKVKSTRLGIYYENLWHFYWQEHPQIELLAHNLQLHGYDNNNRGATLGAFDFLLRHGGQLWHIESAVKFYLGVPDDDNDNASEWRQWIGPNCNDRLDIKLQHLLDHQLPLSLQPGAQSTLAAMAADTKTWQRALCLQGYLFYPAGKKINAPIASHAQHARGEWWYGDDFLQHDNAGYWLPLAREHWFSPAQTRDLHALYSGHNLRDLVQHWTAESARPLMLAAMQKQGREWYETARCFVVPNHWPRTESPSRNT